MIGLDTNVLVRHITGNGTGDEVARARALLHGLTTAQPGYITQVALIETWWVLGSIYGVGVADRLDVLEAMLKVSVFAFERRAAVQRAISLTRRGADFADALIAAACGEEHCSAVMTLDQRAAKRADMTLVSAD